MGAKKTPRPKAVPATRNGAAPTRQARRPARKPKNPEPRVLIKPGHPDFEDDATRALERLRIAVARLVRSMTDGAERAADLRRELDLDAALAWQIHTLAGTDDVLRAGRVIPKAGAMERFFKAAKARRAPADLERDARDAYDHFERLVADHAGDRETFQAMLAALRPADGAALQRLRRAAFRANASVWGVSVRAAVHAVVFRQRASGEHDCLALRARLGIRRLQENALIGIYASGRTWGGSTPPPDGAAPVALDRCELLEQHCSTPVPRLEHVSGPDGRSRDFLHFEGLGRTREVTVFWRNLSLNFPGGSRTPPHGVTSPCTEPAEAHVVDLLVPRGWSDPASVAAEITENSRYTLWGPGAHAQRLPFEGEAEYLGRRLESLYTHHAPEYAQVLHAQLESLGWLDTAFDIYRCTVAYPVLHSAISLSAG